MNSIGNLTVSGTANQAATLTVNGGTLTGGTWNMGTQNVVLSGTTSVLMVPTINGTILPGPTSQFTVGDGTRFTLLRHAASNSTFKILAAFVLRDAVQIDSVKR